MGGRATARMRARSQPLDPQFYISGGCRSTVAPDRSSTARPGRAAARRILTLVNTFPPALAVIPTYNEAATLHRLIETFERDAPWIDVLIVDDASPDGTGALADRMAATRPWLHVLHRPGKDGLGNAYRAGFEWALEHGYPRDRPARRRPLAPALDPARDARRARGAEPTSCSDRATRRAARTEGWPLHRRLASRVGCALSAHALGLPYTDLSGGLKFWLASALDTIDVASTRSQGYVFQVETTQRAQRAGLRIVEVPFTFRERTAGQSKMRASIALEGVRMVARLRRDGWKPQRVASAVAHRRVVRVRHGVEALDRPQSQRRAPLLASAEPGQRRAQ